VKGKYRYVDVKGQVASQGISGGQNSWKKLNHTKNNSISYGHSHHLPTR